MTIRPLLLLKLVLVIVLALGLAACDDGGDNQAADDPDEQTEEPLEDPATPRPRAADLEIAVDPLALADLPEVPALGNGIVIVGDDSWPFTVDFCIVERPLGTGEGQGFRVAWDLRDDGDHRVSVRWEEDDRRYVRGGPADAEVGPDGREIRFAGAFVPFRANDGSEAVPGGLVVVCDAAPEATPGATPGATS